MGRRYVDPISPSTVIPPSFRVLKDKRFSDKSDVKESETERH